MTMVDITKLRIRLALLVAGCIGGKVYVTGMISVMAMSEYCRRTMTKEERFKIYQEYRESISEIYKMW